MSVTRVTPGQLRQMKERGERIPVLTAYDYSMARLLDEAGVPVLLVGDSMGMVVLGHDSTIPVTLEDVIRATAAVRRGARRALVVADLPFMTYRVSDEEALRNAARLVQEGGAHAVKLEGGRSVAPLVRRLVDSGIPVMGHLGFTPQSILQLGGVRVQGRARAAAADLLHDARALDEAGVFALVLELVPTPLAGLISRHIAAPTIGIGAGPECDGEVQVVHDILGLYPDFVPRHTRQYARLGDTISAAVREYVADVQQRRFPTREHAADMDPTLLEGLE
ncbi:MAG: 3-methyl-2-oxobutanoate hydroxymethyltransferase [Chloroflexi bacterium]|nr:3-methyl-2-oxobutanoate hydroxymethyltransferase [Chloroflexota bacterium]